MVKRTSILIIYTGGTIGMALDPLTGELSPLNFIDIANQLPELLRFGLDIKTITFSPPLDSSEVEPEMWVRLAETIGDNYDEFDGFVILHGTDTMAYSASALGFLIENLGKPVIFTGSQLPIGMLRTDGKENLISSIEIAAAKADNDPVVSEVCIFFQNKLFRGNRTVKHNVEYFNAFRSDNYPVLAETGIHIKYNHSALIKRKGGQRPKIHTRLDTNVAILKIFPGITSKLMNAVFNVDGLKAVILETYGSGNAPASGWFISEIERAVKRGITIINVSQCHAGSVDMTQYSTGRKLLEAGVLSGGDMTAEAALTKTMFLLGCNTPAKEFGKLINSSIRGEIT